ncbi:MAG: hypothetical protein HQL12_07900 [Candidatus Omnitrophica bacterium]|nr:hypothetical protein [Candidatus Omnitrophota bacterium]
MKTLIVGMLVFSFFFSIGILLARHKPLWTDELHGQQVDIQRTSWPDIISGHTQDANKFPLHIMLQKAFLRLFNYKLAFVWDGSGLVVNSQAQLVLRILPDILMSVALTAIVLFFGYRSGFAGGAVAVLISLSMPMVWLFWAEARPYSLWFMLTVFQSLLFLDTVSKREINMPALPFAVVHWGLCLTAPLGLIQTIVCQGLLWCAQNKRIKFHLITGLVPLFLGTYYMIAQEKMSMCLFVSWQGIFLRNYPFEGLVFLGMYIILLFLSLHEKECRKYFLFGRIFLPFCLVFIAIALAGLFYTFWKAVPQSTPVAERHFIFLTPIAIIMTAAVFSDLWLACERLFWRRLGLIIIFAAGLLGQLLTTFVVAYHSPFYF